MAAKRKKEASKAVKSKKSPELQEASQEEMQKLKAELDEKGKRADELYIRLQYLQAELENYRKRSEREKQEYIRYSNEQLISKLLPIMDQFEIALISIKERNDDFVTGMRMIYENLVKTLQSEGLQEIKSLGEKFDPYVHEAVAYADAGDKEEGEIVEVMLKGWILDSKVLRPSQVVVVKKGGVSNA